MFSDFLKRVICSHPKKKKKFPTLLVAEIGPFTVNQCVAVLFALLQERWTQHRSNGAAFSPHLSCGSVTSAPSLNHLQLSFAAIVTGTLITAT